MQVWVIFVPLSPSNPKNQKNEEKKKKTSGDIIILHWDMEHNRQNFCHLVVSNLRSETNGSRFEPDASYAQRLALCSNHLANV